MQFNYYTKRFIHGSNNLDSLYSPPCNNCVIVITRRLLTTEGRDGKGARGFGKIFRATCNYVVTSTESIAVVRTLFCHCVTSGGHEGSGGSPAFGQRGSHFA